jgi:twitching motility two-component system response regulator PilG
MPKLLVIDDSVTIRANVRAHLVDLIASGSLELAMADDGYAGWSQIASAPPDMILADVMMPRIDGYQLASLVKSNIKTLHIPFFLLTSKEGEVDQAMGRVRGVDGYLVKPFPRAQLQNLVRNVLGLELMPIAA